MRRGSRGTSQPAAVGSPCDDAGLSMAYFSDSVETTVDIDLQSTSLGPATSGHTLMRRREYYVTRTPAHWVCSNVGPQVKDPAAEEAGPPPHPSSRVAWPCIKPMNYLCD